MAAVDVGLQLSRFVLRAQMRVLRWWGPLKKRTRGPGTWEHKPWLLKGMKSKPQKDQEIQAAKNGFNKKGLVPAHPREVKVESPSVSLLCGAPRSLHQPVCLQWWDRRAKGGTNYCSITPLDSSS